MNTNGVLLAVNAGSSSLKLALFDASTASLERIAHEVFDDLGSDDARRNLLFSEIGSWAERHAAGRPLLAAGHRVVHGGAKYTDPVVIDETVLANLELLVALAPLHQPASLEPVRCLLRSHPELPQLACFDTAFHRRRPTPVQRYGLPDALFQDGIRRYGFHGLSYEYVLSELRRIAPDVADERIVIAHLGSGASLCAVRGGKCVDTTMGFSALGGVLMATRPGEVDPGAVLHLLRDGSRSVADVEDLLYRRSGLLGISGLSGDLRDLESDASAPSREAIETFLVSLVRELGAMIAMLGGIDALVFTGGIGEHSTEIRRRLCERFFWLGLVLDERCNSESEVDISADASRVSIWVIPTDEERMIARHLRRTLSLQQR